MKALLKFRPDLRACELEDRLLPALLVPGATVLTAAGYVLLLSPFPVIASDAYGESGSAGYLTPAAMSVGVLALLPGNTAVVVTPAATGSNGGAALTINVGSGTDDAGSGNNPPVTRNTIANDAL